MAQVVRIQKASPQDSKHKIKSPHLTILFGKLTTTLMNAGSLQWSLIKPTNSTYSNGFWIVNTNEKLALRYNLERGTITPAKLDEADVSFVWTMETVSVWGKQEDYALSPFGKPHLRLTVDFVEIPTDDGFSYHDNVVKLCSSGGSPGNQVWVLTKEVVAVNPVVEPVVPTYQPVGAH